MDSEKVRAAAQVLNSKADFGGHSQLDLGIVLVLFQGRIEATAYPHPESFVAPIGSRRKD